MEFVSSLLLALISRHRLSVRMSLYSDKTLLDEEVESWKGFPWALREPERKIYEQMVEAARRYADAVQHSGRIFTKESFFMALILVQYRMTRDLVREIQKMKQGDLGDVKN